MRRLALLLTPVLLAGCVARTAVNVVTLPVRATAYGYDKLTTSQSEADRNRGRAIRKQGERDRKAVRKAEKDARRADRARDE